MSPTSNSVVDLGQNSRNRPSYGSIDDFCNEEEGRMLAPPNSRKTWSPIEAISRWWRDWTGGGAGSELRCCGREEIGRMAKDAGVSTGEFRKLAHMGPEGAELLFRRLEALEPRSKRGWPDRTENFAGLGKSLCDVWKSQAMRARSVARFGRSRLGGLLSERRNAQGTEQDAVVVKARVVNWRHASGRVGLRLS